MGIQLDPKDTVEFTGRDVAAALRRVFPYVFSDEEEGLRVAIRRAEWIERTNPKFFLDKHEEALAFARRLRTLRAGEACVIRFGDSEEASYEIRVLPGEPIICGFRSTEEERDTLPLIKKCADALDCRMLAF